MDENKENKVEFDDLLKEEPKQDKVEKKNKNKKNKPNVPKVEDKPTKEEPKKAPKKTAKKKPYVHIDTFLQSAKGYFGVTNVQAQGFKSRMNGEHYQRDEQIFIDELKKYLNIK